jgi:protein TonB
VRGELFRDASLLASPEFRRLLLWSCAGHLALAVALGASPLLRWRSHLEAPVYVDIVTSLPEAAPPPQPAPPKPEPPKPAPEQPPKQVVDEIVIPEKPRPKPKARPRTEVAKPQPKPEPKPEKAPSLEELMAELRKEAPPARAAAPSGGVLDPERAAYKKRVEALVASNWVGARNCSARLSFPVWDVQLAASGEVQSASLARSSGDRYCDESAEQAIYKSQPLPPPPGAVRRLSVNFENQ